jgi:23S rRNA (uridine2552-2'-O)-methyltransferase
MSPNRSGHRSLDHYRLVGLVVEALRLARRCLRPEGSFIAKTLQGESHQALLRALRTFSKPSVHKPAASRKESAEVYVLAAKFDPLRFDEHGAAALREVLT